MVFLIPKLNDNDQNKEIKASGRANEVDSISGNIKNMLIVLKSKVLKG